MNTKVLFVDDDLLILNSIAKGLEILGYQVTRFSDSTKVLDNIKDESFDIALLDIRMPGIDGIELAKTLTKKNTLPVIFLSAYTDEAIIQAALKCGHISFLVKPCSLQQIKLSIETALVKFQKLNHVKKECLQLEQALKQSRSVAMAVGALMTQHQLDEKQAFEKLRQSARDQRKKIADVAASFLTKKESI